MFKRLAALAVGAAAVTAAFIPTATAAPPSRPPANGGYSLAGIPLFLFCDDGSPDSQPFGNNYEASTDSHGHFSIAYGHPGWPGPNGDPNSIIPARDFIPRTFTNEQFYVFGADPAQINPWVTLFSETVPDARIGSGKIPKGATLVTCGFESPGYILGPNTTQLPESDLTGRVTGYTVPE